jgi:hypothetical protein
MDLLIQARENRVRALGQITSRQDAPGAGSARRPEGRAFFLSQRAL